MWPLPARARAHPLLGTAPEAAEEARSFFQRRLALVHGVLSALLALAFLSGLPDALATAPQERNALAVPQGLWLFAAVVAALGALGLGLWRGRWSARALAWADVGGTAAASALLGWACSLLPERIDFFSSLAITLTYLQLGRAAAVPSRGRRTLLLGLFAAAVAGGLCAQAGFGDLPGRAPWQEWAVGFWSGFKPVGLSALLAAFTSRVIYGLREEVKQARRLGPYVLEERVGQGGAGVVYRARHALLRRETAVKLLLPGRVGPAALQRFEREVQLTARLTHPSTVAIFDYGRTPDGVFYYAMEYLDGGDLEDVVTLEGPLPPGRVVHVLAQVCRALREAHALGLIHRDIKPANVLLCERGGEGDVAKVVDFGLVKELVPGAAGEEGAPGGFVGTPLYVAPEAFTAPGSVDARSDLYALGALGYRLLTGEAPFHGATAVEVCAHHLHTAPLPPSVRLGRAVPARLEALLLQCLEKEPARRPQSAGALLALLEGCEDVAAWGEAEAAAWWRDRGPALRAHRDARRARALARGPGAAATPGPLTLAAA
jgi:serine/threonine-protein kinase